MIAKYEFYLHFSSGFLYYNIIISKWAIARANHVSLTYHKISKNLLNKNKIRVSGLYAKKRIQKIIIIYVYSTYIA